MSLTTEQQKKINEINDMSQLEMCRIWRFGTNHEYLDTSKPYAEVFRKRLFVNFGGFTPEISKQLGW